MNDLFIIEIVYPENYYIAFRWGRIIRVYEQERAFAMTHQDLEYIKDYLNGRKYKLHHVDYSKHRFIPPSK